MEESEVELPIRVDRMVHKIFRFRDAHTLRNRCFIVPNSKRHIVTTTYLQYIEDPGQVDSYAWRAALLNFLYHAIAEWKKKTSAKKTLDGNIWVILSSGMSKSIESSAAESSMGGVTTFFYGDSIDDSAADDPTRK
ncbi:hypothetical protein AgCh_037656 [Apium graveolens]